MHTPRKRFGQHFLRDQTIIFRIVEALAPQAEEHLIEIGPGQGAITLPVLKRIKQLDVVELDRDLIPKLKEQAAFAELNVFAVDALEFDFASIKTDARQLRIFGNLPYNISTPLIFHLLKYTAIVSDMLFMLQKEVADRLAAEAGSDDYGRLSVMVQYHCQVELLFDVPPEAFNPPPKVQSSIVRLLPYQQSPNIAKDYTLFAALVKQAFCQRRKMIRNSLKSMINESQWAQLSFPADRRPETLTVKEFVEMSNVLTESEA